METEARITECHPKYSNESLTLAPNGPGSVIVTFTYYAHAQIYYDDFRSPVARSRGETFPLFYNALDPRQHRLSPSKFVDRRTRAAAAILGFILLSILILALASG